ncbi:MAG: iron-sulfur cluster assembly accessory protein [Planctomycetes bacterium]|nr:iron-sulfur cluster assembly accessory protein [Planctomycetota bacterium]MCH9727925.1 iron-sulfur cluster assembly accessory protein [Planctomycetota bacterium]MCH9778360.1 iron-sulfur cluster assembly accessory protein [Planctomycetota bacterium]MDF1745115.1 iron-sulfur cluster assembly accessory protein [Gimesia sp.]
MAVTITENASKELKRFMESQEDAGSLLRIGIVSGGCSGFQYDFRFVDDLDEENDTVSEQHGVKVVVDKKSDLLMDGTTVDYYESLEKRGFTFDNPNAVKSCGCGSSFSA